MEIRSRARRILRSARARVAEVETGEIEEAVADSVQAARDWIARYATRNPNQVKGTLGGGAVGTALGLIFFGGGGVGIAALGGAIGLPLALLTGLSGTFLGNRLGIEKDLEELIRVEDERAERRFESAIEAERHATRIKGKAEHDQALAAAFLAATDTLCLRSGFIWINQVRELDRPIREALSRGVNIYIEYGIRSPSRPAATPPPEEVESLEILESIARFARDNAANGYGRLMVARVLTHVKQVVVDGRYTLLGSNNWLSNRAHVNREESVRFDDEVLARDLRDETINLVRNSLLWPELYP